MADNTRMNTQSMDIKRRQMELSMEYERKMKDVKERLSQALCLYYSNEKMRLFGTEGGKEKVYEMELKESWLLYAIKNDVTPLTHDAFPRDFRIQNSPLIVEYFQLKDLPEENSDTDNWLPNAIMAARMFFEWEFGIGQVERNFDNDRIANAFRNAWKVNEAREFFYEKYAGVSDLRGASVTNYKGKFNLKGLFKAGIDPIEQFVGSYDINIYVIDGTHLQFVLKNTTSMKSLLYGIGPEWERKTFRPYGNIRQEYTFSEPIRR
jgi:hypothetical protein